MNFKDSQDKVAQAHGYDSWAAIKWFELDQRFQYDGRSGKSYDILLEEAVELHTETSINEALESYKTGVSVEELEALIVKIGQLSKVVEPDVIDPHQFTGTLETVDLSDDGRVVESLPVREVIVSDSGRVIENPDPMPEEVKEPVAYGSEFKPKRGKK